MELLSSNYQPAKVSSSCFNDKFAEQLSTSSHVDIAVGYISEKSFVYLANYISKKKGLLSCNLLIGMHYFDKFTYSQFAIATETEKFLRENDLGSVKLCTSFPFHGKLYSFSDKSGVTSSIIGSSNLSNILPHNSSRRYEVDLYTQEPQINGEISALIDRLLQISPSLSDPELEITEFRETNNIMDGIAGVRKIDSKVELNKLKKTIVEKKKIVIPITTYEDAPKSNINAYFGKGRGNKRTNNIRRRPWYEVELIVPKNIRDIPWYFTAGFVEKNKKISVITDDGYEFKAHRSGDFGKNLRSDKDLKILGKWLKGRLENAGVLKMSQPVTQDVLLAYGRNNIEIYPTTKEDVWYFDFGRN